MIFLLCKLLSKLIIIVINNFLSLKLITNEIFFYSDSILTTALYI